MEHRKHSDPKSVKKTKDPYNVYYENYLDTNACTECTGLMPNAVHNREEWDTYREIFDFTAKPPVTDSTEKAPSPKDRQQGMSGN